MLEVLDIPAIAAAAHQHGVPLIVDVRVHHLDRDEAY